MTVRTAVLAGVATIEIARPEKKNAITAAMYTAMATALQAADADASVRAVLITGQPGMFTSGNDLDDFLRSPPAGSDAPVFAFMRSLACAAKPVVAAVTGPAIGIGTTMLLHCDLVYVADEAKLSMPFVTLGLVPEFAASLLLPERIGRARAAQALLLGDALTAAEAVEFGIANAVLPTGEVLPHARRMAERFARLPPGAVRDSKRLMAGDAHRAAVLAAIDAEAEVFAVRLRSPEFAEAVQAFFAKRAPDFSAFG